MKKLFRLAAIASAVVMAFGTLSLAACGKDKTGEQGDGEQSKIPEIPEGKNLTDIAVSGDFNTVWQQFGISDLYDSKDIGYKAYLYSNLEHVSDYVSSDGHDIKNNYVEKNEYNSVGKFLSNGDNTYFNDDLHKDLKLYQHDNYFDYKNNAPKEVVRKDETVLDVSMNLDKGVMHSKNIGTVMQLSDGIEKSQDVESIYLVNDKKLDNYRDCSTSLANMNDNTFHSIFGFTYELENAIRDYLKYQSDKYFSVWGDYRLTDYDMGFYNQLSYDLGDSYDFKDYVKKYDVTLKAGDDAFFADISRTIEINIPSRDENYLFENRVVIYADSSAGNNENSFEGAELSDKEKAMPGVTLDPDDIITKFENGEEIDFGTLASGDKINAYIRYNTSANPSGYLGNYVILDRYKGETTIPAGAYSKFCDHLSSVGETGDVEYKLIVEYENSDYNNCYRMCCYSD